MVKAGLPQHLLRADDVVGHNEKRPPEMSGGRFELAAVNCPSALRLIVRRRRTWTMLRHEFVELLLVLGVTQPVEEVLEFGLLGLETLKCLHAVVVEGAVAA